MSAASVPADDRLEASGEDAGDQDTAPLILAAARRVLAREGIGALTIGSIASEAGVYRAAIHYHFGSKDGLIATLIERSWEEASRQSAIAARSCPPGEVRVRSVVDEWVGGASPDLHLMFYDVLGRVLRDPKMREQLQSNYESWTDLLSELLSPSGDEDTSAVLRPYALMLRMFLDGAVLERLINPESDDWKVAAGAVELLLSDALAGFPRQPALISDYADGGSS